ncbi:MAG TPA: universal stress protein [Stellaceae bacterium]|nr:universal stress protein [Stellaceae bacterium]
MIKTILVPATGNQTDDAVFTSALTAARAFNAHLDFLHVRVDAAVMVAAMATDGSGAVTVSGLVERIEEEATRREDAARQLFQRFCERERLAIEDTPAGQQSPTAQWLRQTGDEAYWVREYGRAADLLVIGRPADDQGVSIDTVETALVGTGRPVLIVPAAPLAALPETILIAWKAAPEAARAVTAAMPLLAKAKQILVVTVAEEEGLSDEEGARLATSLAWHGLNASTRHLRPDRLGAADTLLAAAAEQSALVVMGAYGHSRLREWVFGGFTEHVLRGAAVPVLMMH